MSKKIKVKDKPDLVRDSFSKAIINTDRSNYAHARSRKKHLREQGDAVILLQAQVDELRRTLLSLIKTS